MHASFRVWREVLLIPFWTVVGVCKARYDNRSLNAPSRRKTRGLASIQPISQDIRYGMRSLAKSPGFAIIAISILGLGIGANSTMFTLVNSLFLQTPPGISQPGDLVGLAIQDGEEQYSYCGYPDYEFRYDGVSSHARAPPPFLSTSPIPSNPSRSSSLGVQ